MRILELLKRLQEAAEGAAVELWTKDGQAALVLKKDGMKCQKVWTLEAMQLLDAPPASPEKMMIETAQEMARELREEA